MNDQADNAWGENEEDVKVEGHDNTWWLVPAMNGMRTEDLRGMEGVRGAVGERHELWVKNWVVRSSCGWGGCRLWMVWVSGSRGEVPTTG